MIISHFAEGVICEDMSQCQRWCPYGYRQDANGCDTCRCQQCKPMHSCTKSCLYGYQIGRHGCLKCKCSKCPPLTDCKKSCTHGFEINDRGCEICKCQGKTTVHASYINFHLAQLFLVFSYFLDPAPVLVPGFPKCGARPRVGVAKLWQAKKNGGLHFRVDKSLHHRAPTRQNKRSSLPTWQASPPQKKKKWLGVIKKQVPSTQYVM